MATDTELLRHLAYHIFLPPELPQAELDGPADRQVRSKIVESVISSVRLFTDHDSANSELWKRVICMLEGVLDSIKSPLQKDRLSKDLVNMKVDDVAVLYIKAQNAAVIIRKHQISTTFEVFEVQPPTNEVMSIPGKIVRQYPGPAVRIPNPVAEDKNFTDEIANFLVHMNSEELKEAVAITQKAGSDVREVRDSTNPNYFSQLFLGILRGIGEISECRRVVKRIADDVLWQRTFKPWRRSPIWLIVRVALETTLDSRPLFKCFMLFLHADILSQCRGQASFSSDLLYAMRIKVARRLSKIEHAVPEFISTKVSTTINNVEVVLRARWHRIQMEQAEFPKWVPNSFDYEAATKQTLPYSRGYLTQVFQGRASSNKVLSFTPKNSLQIQSVTDFTLYARGNLTKAFTEDKHVALLDFESSVCSHLASWTSRNFQNPSGACQTVLSCFDQYLTAAQSHYTADVADQSVMFLTLVKLWVAIDQLAIKQCELLGRFSPEIPEDILESLLLRSSQHIDQAQIVQRYLHTRHQNASSKNLSIFSDDLSQHTFAIQYFCASTFLQSIKKSIEETAEENKELKLEELQEKNNEYARLHLQLSQLDCTYVKRYYSSGDWSYQHASSCERCRIKNERDSLNIAIHEWPLSSNSLVAEATVFELNRPVWFTIWRDTTYRVLHDLGNRTTSGSAYSPITLEDYSGLRQWRADSISARVIMASSTKSFMQAHYSGVSLPADESQVCVNNGLKFHLYDKKKSCWAAGPFHGASFKKYGTFSLPQGSSYLHLRYALEDTAHTSNMVLADQSNCPEGISPHEHIAFGTLRSGARLQWMNIIRGLAENILTFRREEVYLLHLQAAWQIGPLDNNGHRQWHEELRVPDYGERLIAESEALLERIEANWLEAYSLSTIVILVIRLMSSFVAERVLPKAVKFLRRARYVAFRWVTELRSKLKVIEDGQVLSDYQSRLCEVAAICRSTYDVDPQLIPHLLDASEDLVPLIICSVVLYDNKPPDLANADKGLQVYLHRDYRLSHKILPFIHEKLRIDAHALCKPAHDLWPQYRANQLGWGKSPSSDGRWVETSTLAVNGRASQVVHLNLLEGRLLIDSKPLGRLPRSYIQHPTYIRLFGQTILDVVPSSLPGMDFATRDAIEGYEVSFGIVEAGGELVIQARNNNQTFELVPIAHLEKDLPDLFLTDYHHWAHLEGRRVEFRPRSNPWSRNCAWILSVTGDVSRGPIRMRHGNNDSTLLIDIHSHLFHELSAQLSRLESPHYLHVTKSASGTIDIKLPRMKLEFFLNESMLLESHNFGGYVVDVDQSSGTMLGLKNALVLCSPKLVALNLPRSRFMLIPYGDVQFSSAGCHVSVSIQSDVKKGVQVYRYDIDTDLGLLTSNAGLTSRLFGIYLHALTSHCLPDPLTGCTGTEEALNLLLEPATSSFEQIDQEQARLLHLIGSLTPNREYYPPHLQRMQTVHWSELPSLSQHHAFSSIVANIFARAKALELFRPLNFDLADLIPSPESTLHKRAACRNIIYYPPSVGLPLQCILGSSNSVDTTSLGREHLGSERVEEGDLAAWAASISYRNWGQIVHAPINFTSLTEQWKSMKGSHNGLSLTYHQKWLKMDLSESWMTLYDLCRRAPAYSNRYCLAICLASAAFNKCIPVDLLPVIIAFATNPVFADLNPPSHPNFSLTDGSHPIEKRVEEIVFTNARPMAETPAAELLKREDENRSEVRARRRKNFIDTLSKFRPLIVSNLYSQRSSQELQYPPDLYSPWFKLSNCVRDVNSYFSSCKRNAELHEHLAQVEKALSSTPTSHRLNFTRFAIPASTPPVINRFLTDPWSAKSLESLMASRLPAEPDEIRVQTNFAISKRLGPAVETSRLSALFAEFANDPQPLNRRYGKDLDESRRDLAQKQVATIPKQLPQLEVLDYNYRSYGLSLTSKFDRTKNSLGASTHAEEILAVCGVWPSITPRLLLKQLTLSSRPRSPSQTQQAWQRELVDYAQLFVDYQRSQRMVNLAQSANTEEFWKEVDSIENGGVCEANAFTPDWLLVQIAGNFSIRSVQVEVAQQMISPSSNSNTVFQLNMGEGKSSVVVPVIAASLADEKKLVRVVVLKPLWHQMFQLLVDRLSGLVNRRIYYLPFARDVVIGNPQLQQMEDLLTECIREGGILLAQPEHILSFKLMVIDRMVEKTHEHRTVEQLQRIQDLFARYSRDILDESDEILHVRYQLVYTVGTQAPLEDHPSRWAITQELLNRLEHHVSRMEYGFAQGIHYEKRPHGQFPTMRIMSHCEKQIEDEIISTLANDVILGRIQSLNCTRILAPVRAIALELLTVKDLPRTKYNALKGLCNPSIWGGLLVVRGLLASGIIVFALKQKLYRVDYGLDLKRSLLAVPFRAKASVEDIPSLRAEFGHPDVAVVLTCLSYYYKGLTAGQLENCFELLYKLDNPSQEYEIWTARNDQTPKKLQKLSGVNLRDRNQFVLEIVPIFSRNSAVVDFFLASIVFPKAAKSFPQKLAASGWDLSETKSQLTTGFSGTNDNRYLLPTSITQRDPVKQLNTNALVLTYLLRPENNSYICMRGEQNRTLNAEEFLDSLVRQEPEVRVLLDVGAQMLQLQNEDLVRSWLERTNDSDVEAAVYFNDKDELSVVSRDGPSSSFYSSPYSQQLEKCIVYLDDGHTRGTDLKLPRHTRALVTLGPKVTKDRLLQGCMRMRKLGYGQSVIFAAPPEIDTQIRLAAPQQSLSSAEVDTVDILRWAMLETCKDLQHHVPYWVQQGVEYRRRAEAQKSYIETQDLSTLEAGWVAPEARSLEEMYGVLPPGEVSSFGNLAKQAIGIPDLRDRLELLGVSKLENPGMDEEQEREVSHEVEREVQMERPPKGKPAGHKIRPGVKSFIQSGRIHPGSVDFAPLLRPLASLGPSAFNEWSHMLFASLDFAQTLVDSLTQVPSQYMRPVNWVVRSLDGILVVLSPHEVHELLPDIRASHMVSLHIYAPRVIQSMRAFSNLDFYSVPSKPRVANQVPLPMVQLQLDLFAGQLYFANYRDYTKLCAALGLYAPASSSSFQHELIAAENDGFVKPENRRPLFRYRPEYAESRFTVSPIPALKDLIGKRRKGMKYIQSHLGQILQGRSLTTDDFDDRFRANMIFGLSLSTGMHAQTRNVRERKTLVYVKFNKHMCVSKPAPSILYRFITTVSLADVEATTGALVLALNQHSARTLSQQLHPSNSHDKIRKTYLALVKGHFDPGDSGEIRQNLFATDGRVTTRPVSLDDFTRPRETLTSWRCLSRSSRENSPISLLELGLHTGAKHQLRVVMASVLGAPILGDSLYDPRLPKKVNPMTSPRLMLHASRLEIPRYLRQQIAGRRKYQLSVTAPPPRDFVDFCHAAGIDIDATWTRQPVRVTINQREIALDGVVLREEDVIAELNKQTLLGGFAAQSEV